MPTTAPFDIGEFIDSDPNWHEGWPYVRGTRKTVASVGALYSQGLTLEQIAEEKYMTATQVAAAVCYYLANRQEIDAAVDAYEAESEQVRREWVSAGRRS